MKNLINGTILKGLEKSKELITVKKMLLKENEKMLNSSKKIKDTLMNLHCGAIYHFIEMYNKYTTFENELNSKMYITLFKYLELENFYSALDYNNLQNKYCKSYEHTPNFSLVEIKKILNKKNLESNIIKNYNSILAIIKKENSNFNKIKINAFCTKLDYSNNLIIKRIWELDNNYILRIEKLFNMFINKELLKNDNSLYYKLSSFTNCNFYNFTEEEITKYKKGFEPIENNLFKLKIQKNGYAIIQPKKEVLQFLNDVDSCNKLLNYLSN